MVAQRALAETEEQAELRSTVRRFLQDKSSSARVRELAGTAEGFDRAVWRQMAEQIGLQALPIPEKHGGLDQTSLETRVVFEEMGRALYCGPYLSTVGMAVPALLLSGDDDACAEYLPGIAAGEVIATVPVVEDGGTVTAHAAGDTWTLRGSRSFVVDGHAADLLLVPAGSGDQVNLYAVRGDAAGLTRTPQDSLDLTRRLARVDLADTPARLVGATGTAPEVIGLVLDRVLAAGAAEQAGGAGACLDLSVEYAKSREQFGRAIGAFQAVAHTCVDMLHRTEFARSCAVYAAAAEAEGSAEFPVAARVAAAYCGEAYRQVATDTIHVHGGTGFTWEHDAHLYYRRAWSLQQLFGGAATQHAALADRVGL